MATMSTCGSEALGFGFGEIGRGFGANPAGHAIFNPGYAASVSIRGDGARTMIRFSALATFIPLGELMTDLPLSISVWAY